MGNAPFGSSTYRERYGECMRKGPGRVCQGRSPGRDRWTMRHALTRCIAQGAKSPRYIVVDRRAAVCAMPNIPRIAAGRRPLATRGRLGRIEPGRARSGEFLAPILDGQVRARHRHQEGSGRWVNRRTSHGSCDSGQCSDWERRSSSRSPRTSSSPTRSRAHAPRRQLECRHAGLPRPCMGAHHASRPARDALRRAEPGPERIFHLPLRGGRHAPASSPSASSSAPSATCRSGPAPGTSADHRGAGVVVAAYSDGIRVSLRPPLLRRAARPAGPPPRWCFPAEASPTTPISRTLRSWSG